MDWRGVGAITIAFVRELISVMDDPSLEFQGLTESIIGAFSKVYDYHGYGFVEFPYTNSMELELNSRGHHVEREVRFTIRYLGKPVGLYKCDMLVDDSVVIEVKAGAKLDPSGHRQLFNYLKASRKSVGLLLYF